MASGLDESRLRRLLEVGRGLVAELDREAVLQRVLEVARELTGARYAALGVLTPDRTELQRFLTSGVDDKTHRAIGDLPRGRGLLGELIVTPEPLRLTDISDHPRSYGFPPGHPPMHTFLGAPIMIRGVTWGNLYLTEKEGGAFDERDEESLIVLAEWAGVAIDNARLYEGLELRRDELERAVRGLEATTAIARAVGGETDLDRVLELVVKRARALVDARSLLILLADGEELIVAASAGEAEATAVGTRLAAAESVPGQVIASGHAERLADVGSRVRLGLGDLARDSATALLTPLTFRGRTLGVLVALDRVEGAGEFDDEDERLMRAFSASAATAVATAQSVESGQLRRSLEAAELERKRWARELHDETLQGLGALQVLLTSVLQRADEGIPTKAIVQATEHIGSEIEKLQSLITELRPAALDDIGLGPALESLVGRMQTLHGVELHLDLDLDHESGRRETRLAAEVESTIYRLIQEALSNIGKHAAASEGWVRVSEAGGMISYEVRDDGRGFDPTQPKAGFGLVGMRERIDLIGGSMVVESAPDEGTTIRAEVPSRSRPAEANGQQHAKTG